MVDSLAPSLPGTLAAGGTSVPAAGPSQPDTAARSFVASTPAGSAGPQRSQVAPWTPAEREAQDVLQDQRHLTSTDSVLWSKLERMESNLRPLIGTNVNDSTNRYVNSLQDSLTTASYSRAVALNEIEMLKDDPWSLVPFSRQSNELNAAHRNVKMFEQELANTRVQIDKLVQQRPHLLTTPAVNPDPPRDI
jgi:hypothetical protein